jgi:hypothetical protein
MLPSATIALARIVERAKKIEVYVLCDSVAVVYGKAGDILIRDTRLSELDGEVIRALGEYAKDNACPIDEARKALRHKFTEVRKKRGRDFFALDFDARNVKQGLYGEYDFDGTNSLLLCTDGFYRLFDTFKHINNISELRKRICADGLDSLWEVIDEYEKADANCLTYPRTKQFDDTSAIYIDLC